MDVLSVIMPLFLYNVMSFFCYWHQYRSFQLEHLIGGYLGRSHLVLSSYCVDPGVVQERRLVG